MTLCLCGASDNGKYAAMASDGMLSYGNLSADVGAPKYQWFGDWLFMFAGVLSSTELIVEEVRQQLAEPSKGDPFSRQNIQKTIRRAFNQRVANWSAIRNLSMYNMDMEEFTRKGKKAFYKDIHSRLAAAIYADVKKNYSDEMLVIGWGKSPLSIMLYVIEKQGDSSHSKDGHCAIGCGRDIALSTLLKLKHGVRSTLQSTIYSILVAKFSAEGRGVGRKTDLWLLRKRRTEDTSEEPVAIDVPDEKIDAIRTVWNNQKRGFRISIEALRCAAEIVQLTKDQEAIDRGSMEMFKLSLTQSASRKSKQAR